MLIKEMISLLIIKGKSNRQEHINRDIDIVLEYFGFSSTRNPTLESIGDKYDIERERVRQIIEKKFKSRISQDEIDLFEKVANHIAIKEIHRISVLEEDLVRRGFIEIGDSFKGILNLLHTLNFLSEYDLYSPDLNKATVRDVEGAEELYLISKKYKNDILKKLRSMKTLPGMSGLCNAFEIMQMQSFTELDKESILDLLLISKNSWTYSTSDNQTWYLIENRDNIIINSLEKIKNLTSEVEIDVLASVISATISKRSFKHQVPSVEIIKQYLLNSRFIKISDKYAIIETESTGLTDIEQALITIFKARDTNCLNYIDLKRELEEYNFSKVYIDKCIYCSPLIYVDKSHGRKNYEFRLISNYYSHGANNTFNDDYANYKNKLKHLYGETDLSSNARLRREQSILRNWLFSNKSSEECAICKKTFSIDSLIAAHKKKRCNCSEGERTDPNIVMPLCVFGCDSMYEREYIEIKDDKVIVFSDDKLTETEIDYLLRINGSILNEKWAQGKSYFRKSSLNIT